jgi:hypothetical protein
MSFFSKASLPYQAVTVSTNPHTGFKDFKSVGLSWNWNCQSVTGAVWLILCLCLQLSLPLPWNWGQALELFSAFLYCLCLSVLFCCLDISFMVPDVLPLFLFSLFCVTWLFLFMKSRQRTILILHFAQPPRWTSWFYSNNFCKLEQKNQFSLNLLMQIFYAVCNPRMSFIRIIKYLFLYRLLALLQAT